MATEINILIIGCRDDELFIKPNAFRKDHKYSFFMLTNKKNLFTDLAQFNIEIIILKPALDEEGIAILKTIKEYDPQLEVIFISNSYSIEYCVKAVKLGAFDYIKSSQNDRRLLISLEQIQEKKVIRSQTLKLEEQLHKNYLFEGMIGKSPKMLEIFSFIRRISKHPTTVLITGETGTGKELVAKAIHNLSNRCNKRFVSSNCSALAETLLESELFGHVKGAFTGAIQTKYGLFEYADGGTIFLDEIGEISLSMQAKLLRVLENRELQRVGANEIIQIDIRIISATNKDLYNSIKEKSFREDLFYRLNVINIHLPPLRERKEDIPLLCSFFLEKYNNKFNKSVKGISQPCKILLMNHKWEGNIRELENTIERSVSLTKRNFITPSDLPDYLSETTKGPSNTILTDEEITLEELEKRYILRILEKTEGNKVRASKVLGLSRRSLYRKLDRYNIET